MYDPAARGYITDATPPDRRGEAFGLYGAAQMGGLLLGPAIGGIGASLFGGGGVHLRVRRRVSSFLAAARSRVRVRERPVARRTADPGATADRVPLGQPEHPARPDRRTTAGTGRASARSSTAGSSRRSCSRSGQLRAGTYEVIWSLFLHEPRRRARADRADVRHVRPADPAPLAVLPAATSTGAVACRSSWSARSCRCSRGVAYTHHPRPALAVPLILVESTGFAILCPALFTIVAAGSPDRPVVDGPGHLRGGGHVGFVVASLIAGQLAEIDIRLPF